MAATLDCLYKFLDLNFKIEPKLVIYLKTHPEVLLERIKKRARKEESSKDLNYLINYQNILLRRNFTKTLDEKL